MTYGKMGERKENCDPASGCCNSPADIGLDKYDKDFDGKFYKPWYSSRFNNMEEVADYWKQQYDELEEKFTLFTECFLCQHACHRKLWKQLPPISPS